MFKIVTADEVTILCGDVRIQLMELLSKKYYLNYSIMTLDDMICFAIESNTIKTIQPIMRGTDPIWFYLLN